MGACSSSSTSQLSVERDQPIHRKLIGTKLPSTDAQGKVSAMVYDSAGRKREMRDPDMGWWRYSYDPAGNLTSQTDAKN